MTLETNLVPSPKNALELLSTKEDPVSIFINGLEVNRVVYYRNPEKSWIGEKDVILNGEPVSLAKIWPEVNLSFLITHQATGCFRTGANGQLTTILIKKGEVVHKEGFTPTDPRQLNFLETMGIGS